MRGEGGLRPKWVNLDGELLPEEAIFAWAADNEEINETATSAPRAVASRLELGDEVKFRVARLHEHPPLPLPPEQCDAGLPCRRCLILVALDECPRRHAVQLACAASPLALPYVPAAQAVGAMAPSSQ